VTSTAPQRGSPGPEPLAPRSMTPARATALAAWVSQASIPDLAIASLLATFARTGVRTRRACSQAAMPNADDTSTASTAGREEEGIAGEVANRARACVAASPIEHHLRPPERCSYAVTPDETHLALLPTPASTRVVSPPSEPVTPLRATLSRRRAPAESCVPRHELWTNMLVPT
jgi:hypothetical protein